MKKIFKILLSFGLIFSSVSTVISCKVYTANNGSNSAVYNLNKFNSSFNIKVIKVANTSFVTNSEIVTAVSPYVKKELASKARTSNISNHDYSIGVYYFPYGAKVLTIDISLVSVTVYIKITASPNDPYFKGTSNYLKVNLPTEKPYNLIELNQFDLLGVILPFPKGLNYYNVVANVFELRIIQIISKYISFADINPSTFPFTIEFYNLIAGEFSEKLVNTPFMLIKDTAIFFSLTAKTEYSSFIYGFTPAPVPETIVPFPLFFIIKTF